MIIDKADIKHLLTKQDLKDFHIDFLDSFNFCHDEILNKLEEISTILKRMDQERIFTFEYVKRLETDTDKNSREIEHIKDVLRIN